MVLLQTLKLLLAENASELPSRVAAGPSMALPKKMNDEQTRNFHNIAQALKPWGIAS